MDMLGKGQRYADCDKDNYHVIASLSLLPPPPHTVSARELQITFGHI